MIKKVSKKISSKMVASRAFTLIELLVVIAIIGILSSVVLASLSSSRLKARDAIVLAELTQFANLAELQYSDTGSYAGLQRGWVPNAGTCEQRYTLGNYAAQAIVLCNAIVAQHTAGTVSVFHSGVNAGLGFTYTNDYSFMARLPSSGYYACVGSSGKSVGPWNNWNSLGCYNNP